MHLNLKLAVLGACTCSGPEGEPCSCAKMSAATRKQLLQLKQEVFMLGLKVALLSRVMKMCRRHLPCVKLFKMMQA